MSKNFDAPFFKLDNGKDLAVSLPLEQIKQELASSSSDKSFKIAPALFIALDTSGSMSSDLNDAKRGIIDLLDKVYSNFELVTLFTFDDTCTEIPLSSAYKSEIAQVRSSGSTNFVAVMNKIHAAIAKSKSERPIHIVFFTDGCHNYSAPILPYLAINKPNIQAYTCPIRFNCIGFTSGHDVSLLNEIVNYGNCSGTFQYAKNSASMQECLGNLVNCLEIEMPPRFCLLVNNELEIEVTDSFIVFIPSSVSVKTLTLIDASNINEPIATLTLIPCSEDQISPAELLMSQASLLHSKVLSIVNEMVKGVKQADIAGYREEADLISLQLTALIEGKEFKSASKLVKRSVFEKCDSIFKLIAMIHELLKKAVKGLITTDSLATLLSSSYDNITKRSLSNKLNTRVQDNQDMLIQCEKKIAQIYASINFNDIYLKSSALSRSIFKCAISTMDWVEALKEKDVICMTIRMARSQAAIAEPSLLRICDINPTFLSAQTFSESIEFKLNDSASSSVEDIHGGFSNKVGASSVVQGVAREGIDAVVPLYLCKEHWKISKEAIKPLFGWMTTLDVLGYDQKQLYTIPILTLAHFLEKKTHSEMSAILFFSLFRTCLALYKDFNMRVLDFENPMNRLSDEVPSLHLLLGKLLCEDKYEKNVNKIAWLILEEFIRRSLANVNKAKSDGELLTEVAELLGCNAQVTIRSDKTPKELFLDEVKHEELPWKLKSVQAEEMINSSHGWFVIKLVRFVKLYKLIQALDKNKIVEQLDEQCGVASNEWCSAFKAVFADFYTNPIQALREETGCNEISNENLLAVHIQSVFHNTNSARRNAIQGKQYLDAMFSAAEAKKVVAEVIENTRKMELAKIAACCRAEYFRPVAKGPRYELNLNTMKLKLCCDVLKGSFEEFVIKCIREQK